MLFAAKTPYFMWAAADDLWAESFIARNLAFLEAHPDFVMGQSRVLFTAGGNASHLSTGTYAITGAPAEAAVQYFTNPADNSRYYGLFRTSALQAVFPPRNFHALDWAVSAATLRHGKHNEIQDILMIRDLSDAAVYEKSVLTDHKFILWRVFPLLFLTLYVLRHRLVPFTPRLAYALLKLNLYLHFRFGLYRWRRLGDLYVQTGALSAALSGVAAPGLKQRLRVWAARPVRWGIGVMRAAWRRLPFTLEQRFAIYRFFSRRLPWLAARVSRNAASVGLGSAAGTHLDSTFATAPDCAQSLAGLGWQPVKLAAGAAPAVSVVLTASEGLLDRLRVIDALVRSSGTLPFEVVLIDRGSCEVMPANPGVISCRIAPNSTFAEAVNKGAALARSEKLVFLDGAMLPHAGFLESLLSGLATAALVGPQVRTGDGRLYSAGGMFNALARPQCNGYLEDPSPPNRQVSAAVDFCCGAFAISKTDLHEVGDLDPALATLEIATAYLAIRLREQGKKTIVRPRAVVTAATHVIGGASSISEGVGGFGGGEWQAFLRRHGAAIARQHLSRNGHAAASGQPKRVLYIDADTPTPDQNSGSNDALNMMRIFVDMGYAVTFIPESNFSHRGRYTEKLQDFGIHAVWYPYSSTVQEVLTEIAADLDVVVLCRGDIAEKYIELVRELAPRARIIFNSVDLHFLRMQREAELNNDAKLLRRAKAMQLSELDSVKKVDATIVVSSFEKELLKQEVPQAAVHLVPLIREIPDTLAVPDARGRRDILFVGTYQHPPNCDAAIFFAKQVFPLVRSRIPNARVLLVGSEITPEISALAGEGVEVLGFVEDLDALLRRCRLSVAPLRYGAGIKGKIATALQMGLPTVATTIAVEGTPLVPDMEIMVADKPEQFAAAVIELYTDDEKWRRLSEAGFQFARREYSIDANRARIKRLFAELDLGAQDRSVQPVDGLDQPPRFWSNLQTKPVRELSSSSAAPLRRSLNNS